MRTVTAWFVLVMISSAATAQTVQPPDQNYKCDKPPIVQEGCRLGPCVCEKPPLDSHCVWTINCEEE